MFPKDYDATVGAVRTLGRLYGSPDAGEALATDMSSRRDAVVAAVAGAPRPRVYEELDASQPDMPFAAGPNGFYGQLIDLAGGTNIFADLPGDAGRVGAESIIDRDPEVIVLTDSDLPFNPQSPDMVRARPGWSVITAVRNGAIYPFRARCIRRRGRDWRRASKTWPGSSTLTSFRPASWPRRSTSSSTFSATPRSMPPRDGPS